ncbi:MAG: ABC transporter permease subunit [Clostridia bacterium]|nr:ABC transporter permease subunit [Clostridia bacterium]
MGAIYKRELLAYFKSPIGYVFSAIFFAISGICFVSTTVSQGSTNTSAYFAMVLMFFVILIPLLTMKLLSEEKKLGTEQLLLTSPVSLVGVICAKFFAAFTIFAGTLGVSSLLNMLALYDIASQQEYVIAKMNLPTFIGCIIGVLLIGASFIAIGLFISSLTENQIISAVVSIGAFALIMASSAFAANINNTVIRVIVKWFSVMDRFIGFQRGIFDITALVYYISLTTVFLFLTVRVYEKRRWE